MAIAHGKVAPSYDLEFSRQVNAIRPQRVFNTKGGYGIAYPLKRVGAHQPKKQRNQRRR